MESLKYLAGYPPHVLDRVRALLAEHRLGTMLADKYGDPHRVRNDGQLYEYVQALKERHMRKAPRWSKVLYDSSCSVKRRGHPHGDLTRTGRQAQGQPRDPHRHRVPRCARRVPEDDRGP
jgi:hypothetical protein